MIFKSVELENFKSFAGNHSLVFMDYDTGLHFLTGENKVNPRLGANGAGKSTLFDAIFWCFYGETTRSLRARDVSPWWADKRTQTRVVVNCQEFSIQRAWNPNKLQIKAPTTNDKWATLDQKQLHGYIGLNSREFVNSIILGQFNKMFFDLSPSEKLSMFSDLMGLDYWDDRAKQAGEDWKYYQQQYDQDQALIQGIDQTLRDSRTDLEEAKENSSEWEEQKERQLSKIRKRIKKIKRQLKEQAAETLNTSKLEDRLSEKAEEVDNLRDKQGSAESRANRTQNKISSKRAELQQLDKQINKLEEVRDTGECPYCEQQADVDHFEAEIAKLRDQGEKLQADIDRLVQKKLKYEKQSNKYEEQARDAREKYHEISQEIKEAEKQVREAQREQDRLKSELEQARRDRDNAKSEDNPYTKQIDKLSKRIRERQQEREQVEQRIEKTSRNLEAAKYWHKGFKEIRLMVVQEALGQLELEVNNSLVDMGLDTWRIKFEVERENRSGGISKGFHVLIENDNSGGPVRWEAWSGGETQRLRLAGVLGLSNLILERKGIQTNMLVLDEPTQHMNDDGVDDLLDLLFERAVNNEQQVWLIDHRSIDYGGFATTTKIIQDEQGSRIDG